MKKLNQVLLIVAFLTAPCIAFAQKMYVDVNLGYAFPANQQNDFLYNITSNYVQNIDNGATTAYETMEPVPLSLGKGFNFGVGVGYMFNKHLGTELQLQYLIGAKTSSISTYNQTIITNGIAAQSQVKTCTTYTANMLQIIPTIVFAAGTEKINPYAKVGLILGFGSAYLSDEFPNSNDAANYKIQFSGGMAIGANTRLGVDFTSKNKLTYFAELNITSLSYSPQKNEVIVYQENGIDLLASLTTRERETEYVKEMSSFQSPPSSSEPDKQFIINMPFSSFGFNVGVRFTL